MKLKDVIPSFGCKIFLYCDSVSGSVQAQADPSHKVITGTVIGKWVSSANITDLYLIGWTATESPPRDPRIDFASNFNDNGPGYYYAPNRLGGLYRTAMWVPSEYEVPAAAATPALNAYGIDLGRVAAPIPTNVKQETKCKNRTCRATCFVADAHCWNCGVSEPGK